MLRKKTGLFWLVVLEVQENHAGIFLAFGEGFMLLQLMADSSKTSSLCGRKIKW
jgi:hypothetical protein